MTQVIQLLNVGNTLYALDSDGVIWIRTWNEAPHVTAHWTVVPEPYLPVTGSALEKGE